MKAVIITRNFMVMLSVILPFAIFGQSYRLVTGKVEDASTGKPLPYSSVSLLHSTISNIANSEGIFTLKIPVRSPAAENLSRSRTPAVNNVQTSDTFFTKRIQEPKAAGRMKTSGEIPVLQEPEQGSTEDTLLIGYLGYETKKVPVGKLSGKRPAVIRLEPSPISLKAITVRPEDALLLFNLAFSDEKIRENYPQQTSGLTGFYREIIKRGNQFVTLNEAVLDIAKTPYRPSGADQIAIYRGRGSRNIRVTDTLFLRLQGGPVSALYVDLMKNPFVGTDMFMAPYYYDFWMGPAVYKDGNIIYSLLFNQKDSVKTALYNGRIFIDGESAAVVRAEFSLNAGKDPNAWKYFVRKKPNNVKIGVDYANYAINYKKYGDKWYPDYIRIEVKFNAKYQGKWMKSKYLIVSEMAITDIDNPQALNPRPQNKIRYRDEMSQKVNNFTDSDFWENYNIIEPDESIENIIHRIIRQLKRRGK